MTRRRLHMIGNAHIDPVWLWTWPEGLAEVRATFRSALDRMREYPEFRFTQGSAAYYAWIEEHEPAMFEEIRARVAEGRWELAGGWWVEPDCNIPSGESFVRQALLGQRFFASRFGATAVVGMNADPFGHAATLPAILAGSGLRGYAFLRPGPHELELPPVFWWEAPDGSRVLALRIPHEYCAPGGDVGGHVDKVVAHLPASTAEAMCFYGVGNHGGGPTRANLDSIARLNDRDLAPELVLSTLAAFLDVAAAQPDLPVVRGELLHHAVGCYSAHTGVKRWVRRGERLLLAAESLAAVGATIGGRAYPRADLERAWGSLLFNEFHDILAGTAIEAAYVDARDQLGETAAIATRALHAGITAIASRIDIPFADDLPAVVVNPHPWPVTATVEVEGFRLAPGFRLCDETGAGVPVQATRAAASVATGGRARIAFTATVPALGWRLYRLARTGGQGLPWESRPPLPEVVPGEPIVLDNGLVRVAVDPADGRLSVGLPGASAPVVRGRRFVVYEDDSDTWSHRVLAYRREAGAFQSTAVRWIEAGPVRSVVRVEHRFGESTLTEDVILAAGLPYVEIRGALDWRERLRLLKLRVDVAAVDPVATHAIPFGTVVRAADGTESPIAGSVDVSGIGPDGHGGATVFAPDRPGADVRGSEIGITIVRSPAYAHHDPAPAPDDPRATFLDQGAVPFACALFPHAGAPDAAEGERLGAVLALPPVVMWESFHAGPLPGSGSFIDITPPSVVATAVKLGEDDDRPVVRLRETAGIDTRARVRFGAPAAAAVVDGADGADGALVDIGAFALATVRLEADGSATRLDLLERPLEDPGSFAAQRPVAASANEAMSG